MTAQVAMQQAEFAAWNVWSSINGQPPVPFRYQHLGNMMGFGRDRGAVQVGVARRIKRKPALPRPRDPGSGEQRGRSRVA